MRELLMADTEINLRLKEVEQKIAEHDGNILVIFEYLRQLEQSRQHQEQQAGRKKIGFRKEKP
jgi:hypothetical protein